MVARLAQANLASKSDIANFVKKAEFEDKLKNLFEKVMSSKTKHVLLENELNELSEKVKAILARRLTKDLINKFTIFNGAKYNSGIFLNYSVFIPTKNYMKSFSGTNRINSLKSNGMLEENVKNVTKSDRNLAPSFVD